MASERLTRTLYPAFTQSPLMTEALMEKPYVSYTQHLPKTAWDKLGRGHRMIQAAGREEPGQWKGN